MKKMKKGRLFISSLIIVLLSVVIMGRSKTEVIGEVSKTFKAVNGNVTSIVIKNVQNDIEQKSYSYKIRLADTVGAVKYSINGIENYLVFDAKGEAIVNLSSNQTLTLFDVAVGKSYSIEQNKLDNYETVVNGVATNVASGVTAVGTSITFTNNNSTVSKNPETVDTIGYVAIILGSLIVFVVLLKKLKIKRYE